MYIYIYKYICERICITLSLSCMHTHAHSEGRMSGETKRRRNKGAEGLWGRGAEGLREWGVEGLGSGESEWDNSGYVHQLHNSTPMLISWVVR